MPSVGFLLPGATGNPVGGVKVAFEYANALAARGWAVKVAMPHMIDEEEIQETRSSPWLRLRCAASYMKRRARRGYLPSRWFNLDPNVAARYLPTPEPWALPAADAWVATSWRTAKWVVRTRGARLYLVQHVETWGGPEAQVMATWKAPLRKIVVSRWLQEVARELGETADYIPNGLDFSAFGVDVAPAERRGTRVLMLFHSSPWKGSADGIAALQIARTEEPRLEATLFGVKSRPVGLPSWIRYEKQPPQQRLRELYNSASVFLAPSWTEGWGLPATEAMACGCALVATDVDGHREFAHDGETALLAPPREPVSLARQLLRIVGDAKLRLALARTGNAYVQRFTWSRATDQLESVLREEIGAVARGSGTVLQVR